MTISTKNTLLSYDRLVPRYTSYPTAPHFQDGVDAATYLQWLYLLPATAKLSLYLHVPFCPKMCWYCGCHTKITQRYSPVEDYANLMLREIAMLGQVMHPTQMVQHIHFGGGSPSMLLPKDFENIMNALGHAFVFADDAEIAMEVDPRGLTEEHVKAYVRSGLNRVSLGVQDFNQKVLESVNRPQPFELSAETVRLFRSYGVDRINFDFLYGLPHQTVATMRETMLQAISLSPNRVSLFGYAHVPWMKKHMQLMDMDAMPDNSLRYDLFETASEILTSHGYVAIGIDHFAKEDDGLTAAARNGSLHRNFQGYTTDVADALIGIGSSAIGKFPQGYIQNSPHAPIYRQKILNGELPVAKSCSINDDDKLRADVIEQLMCGFQVDIGAVCTKHGFAVDYLDSSLLQLKPFENDGLVKIKDKRFVCVGQNMRQIVRLVAAVFDAYLAKAEKNAPPRHARAI